MSVTGNKGIALMISDIKIISKRMARPKMFTDRALTRLSPGTFDAIARVLAPREERAAFIREAVDLLTAVRDPKIYTELKSHLLQNETPQDFIVKAVARAVAHRKAALEGDK
jgi:hypothetical protein